MTPNRRPIKSRSNEIIRGLASRLATCGITPNQVSTASVAFAAIAAAALLYSHTWPAMLIAILGIQLRLLCNVVDGLIAVEGGKKSLLGALYNEFPDRIADSLLLVAAGYAAGIPWLGWLSALLAALTAYVRVFGGALGLEQRFLGPMAKQQRMALLSAACLLVIVETALQRPYYAMGIALAVIAAGSALTCVTRTRAIARDLAAASS